MAGWEPIDQFSLVGGLLHRATRGLGAVATGLALGWGAWLVFIALALFDGRLAETMSLAYAAGHARLLLAMPLLFACEAGFDASARDFVRVIAKSELVAPDSRPAFEAECARVTRWSQSLWPDLLSILLAVAVTIAAQNAPIIGRTMVIDRLRDFRDIAWGGLWYWFVCLPLFRLLWFRWLIRILLWCRFLWRVSRLDLRLAPAHPDGVGGLGALEVAQSNFAPLVLAMSIVIAAAFAEEIASGVSPFEVVYPALLVTLIVDAILFLAPPCLFAPMIRRCREQGLLAYSQLAARYVMDFDRKWLGAKAAPEELLGAADIQSLADLSNSYSVIRSMRWAPISARLAITIAVAALAPMAPLYLFRYPLATLAEMVFRKLTGL